MKGRIFSYILITISILLSLTFFNEEVLKLTEKVTFNMLVGFASIAAGVSGVLMSLSTKKVANFEAIREYFQQGDTPEMIASRNSIYDSERYGNPVNPKIASEICSFFHFWGMMVEKGFLPIWIFKSASGPSIVKLHHILFPYIKKRQADGNSQYAEGFTYLVNKIKKKYKYVYIPDQNKEIEVQENNKSVS